MSDVNNDEGERSEDDTDTDLPYAKAKHDSEEESWHSEDSNSSDTKVETSRKRKRISTPQPTAVSSSSTKVAIAVPHSPDPASVAKDPPNLAPKSPKKKTTVQSKRFDGRSYDIVLPHLTDSTLLIQLDTDAPGLDGVTGAIGRIEASEDQGTPFFPAFLFLIDKPPIRFSRSGLAGTTVSWYTPPWTNSSYFGEDCR